MAFSSTQAQVFYCSECWHYIGPTGKRVPYSEDAEVIVWTPCSACLEKRSKEEVEEEERRRQMEERTRPRRCELEGCGELFVAATVWQAYCCDAHRWRAHRRRKAAVAVSG